MAQVVVAQRMWQRRGSTAEWASKNPTLEAGEIGVEFTSADEVKMKVGNGTSPWASLPYVAGDGSPVEMRVSGGYIQYSNDGVEWENLISVASLKGDPGAKGDPGTPVQMRASGTLLQWKYTTASIWTTLFDLATLASGGVRPMVNGDIVNNQPVFMYNEDTGEYIYAEG